MKKIFEYIKEKFEKNILFKAFLILGILIVLSNILKIFY